MRFLADQDVYTLAIGFLERLGHDVATAANLGLTRPTDAQLLDRAQRDGRIFVTRDRDFGGIVFVQGRNGGVIYLRILPSTIDAIHQELARVLTLYAEIEIGNSFIVVEPGRHRIRRAPPESGR